MPPPLHDGCDCTEDVQDLKEWIAGHVKYDELWKVQNVLNTETKAIMAACQKRIESIERKIIWFCGIAAGVGAVIGGSLPQLLTKIGG